MSSSTAHINEAFDVLLASHWTAVFVEIQCCNITHIIYKNQCVAAVLV